MTVKRAISKSKVKLIEHKVNNCEGGQKMVFSVTHALLLWHLQ